MSSTNYLLQETTFGRVAVVWQQDSERPKIIRVILSAPGSPADRAVMILFPGSRRATCGDVSDVASGIRNFLEGDSRRFRLDGVALELCSHFQRRVLIAEHRIPRGKVSTYGLIARHLGMPSAGRAVGRALATNPFPIIIPCHRAIRSDRSLGGYQGGIAMKRALLQMEGIGFDAAGRVITSDLHYAGAL